MLNKKLQELREKAGLSQKELSARLKMARTTYSGYENGAREPDHDTLNRIADFFDVSTDYLLGRTEKPNKVLSDPSRALIDFIDAELTDQEILQKINFKIDGIQLDEEDMLRFITLVRTARLMKKQSLVSKGGNQQHT